jgi:hypothetical protein
MAQAKERQTDVDAARQSQGSEMQQAPADASARDAAGRVVLERLLAEVGPNPTPKALVDEMRKLAAMLPDPASATERDVASADAGRVRELIDQLDAADPEVLARQLVELRNVSHRVAEGSSAYASAAAAAFTLAMKALSLVASPAA